MKDTIKELKCSTCGYYFRDSIHGDPWVFIKKLDNGRYELTIGNSQIGDHAWIVLRFCPNCGKKYGKEDEVPFD